MEKREFRYYDFVMAAFVVILICSNAVGAGKVCQLFGLTFSGGVLFFPVSYIFGDVLTEVYGFARARRVVWAGFGAMGFLTFATWFVLILPPAEGWPNQAAYVTVFGATWRIAMASLVAYFVGEFSNSYVLAKMKVATGGKHLWTRTLGSTVIGEAVDSAIFYPLAFVGVWENELVLKVTISNYVIKVVWETIATPLTYLVVNFLKRAEGVDHFDRDTNFTPFSLKV